MAPVGAPAPRVTHRAASSADLGQRGFHERLFGGDEKRGPADLGHGGRDEVGVDEVDGDVVRGEFGGEGVGPLLEEGLGAGVGGQVGGGEEAAEGAHGEDEAAGLAGEHAAEDELGDV